MQTKNDVLVILEKSRGRFVSGQELADSLRVSRAAVWKAVKALREEGHLISAATNKGYTLDAASDLLTEAGVRAALPERYRDNPIYVLSVTDSTNTQAKKRAADGAAHGTLLLAEEQTAGRGRSGKSFFSPRGAGLYMSLVLRPTAAIKEPQMVTVAAAVAVCRAIEMLTDLKPQIKWVNDLYLDGKKICGILTEAVTDFESGGVESIVVGVGVDCALEESRLPSELRGLVGSLGAGRVSRSRLAAEIAAGLLDSFGKLSDRELIAAYRARSMILGRTVCFARGEERFTARATAVDDMGALLVTLPSGETMTLTSGEVSIGSLAENTEREINA